MKEKQLCNITTSCMYYIYVLIGKNITQEIHWTRGNWPHTRGEGCNCPVRGREGLYLLKKDKGQLSRCEGDVHSGNLLRVRAHLASRAGGAGVFPLHGVWPRAAHRVEGGVSATGAAVATRTLCAVGGPRQTLLTCHRENTGKFLHIQSLRLLRESCVSSPGMRTPSWPWEVFSPAAITAERLFAYKPSLTGTV